MTSALDRVLAVHGPGAVELTEAQMAERDEAAILLAQAAHSGLQETMQLLLSGQPVPFELVESASLALSGVMGTLELREYDWVEATAWDPREVRMAGDGKSPYGPVEYADPGYQSDGKKRYPVDNEEHTRAAWSYINKGKNASAYSSGDLAKVKAKIKSAMKKHGIQASDDDSDQKVAASNVLVVLAGPAFHNVKGEGNQTPTKMVAIASMRHRPMFGLHEHMHTHVGDNHHGPSGRLALAAGKSADIMAHQHPEFHGTHGHPHMHHNDANHGPDQGLVDEMHGRPNASW